MTAIGKPRRTIVTCAAVALWSVGCATTRLNDFNNLSTAGAAYVTATQAVLDSAATSAVSADSAILIAARPTLKETARQTRLKTSNNLLKQRLTLLSALSAHGKLLQQYFEAIGALSDPNATDTVATAAQSAYKSLSEISMSIKNAKVGATGMSTFIKDVADPVVATFKVRRLDTELKTRSSAIAREIALEQAAFAAISSDVKTDLQVQQNLAMEAVLDQYDSAAALPNDWASARLANLKTPTPVAALDAAAAAATKLQQAFSAVVGNRLDAAGFASLMSDTSNLLTIAGTIEKELK